MCSPTIFSKTAGPPASTAAGGRGLGLMRELLGRLELVLSLARGRWGATIARGLLRFCGGSSRAHERLAGMVHQRTVRNPRYQAQLSSYLRAPPRRYVENISFVGLRTTA